MYTFTNQNYTKTINTCFYLYVSLLISLKITDYFDLIYKIESITAEKARKGRKEKTNYFPHREQIFCVTKPVTFFYFNFDEKEKKNKTPWNPPNSIKSKMQPPPLPKKKENKSNLLFLWFDLKTWLLLDDLMLSWNQRKHFRFQSKLKS